jgi:hypothetical protein
MSNTTLGQWASPDIPLTAREYVRARAQTARESLGKEGAEHVAALESLADYMAGCDPDDPRMWTLALVGGCYGDRDRFHAGKMTDELLHRLGNWREGAAPHNDVSLSELIGAEVSDLIETLGGRVGEETKAREAAEEEVKGLRERADNGDAVVGEVAGLRERVEVLEAEKAEVEAQLSYVKAHYGSDKKKVRRTKVPDETGIYFNELVEGRPYEIGWTKDGKQRWETVGADLDEARKLRAERSGKKEA